MLEEHLNVRPRRPLISILHYDTSPRNRIIGNRCFAVGYLELGIHRKIVYD